MATTHLQKDTQHLTSSGETVEQCFANMAASMFNLFSDIENVHGLQIITFEFFASENEKALAQWLNLLLTKAKEHQLIFGDFRLKRTADKWEATVSGEPYKFDQLNIKAMKTDKISISKNDHIWEARCVLSFK